VSGPVRLLDLGAVSPLRSQALYHGLGEAMAEGTPDTLVLCRPDAPYFCVGYHQRAAEVLDLALCRRAGWPVLRRRIGGGAVYLDPGQLFYQVIVHRRRAPFAVADIYRRYLGPPVEALRRLGLRARLRGVNEIEVGGRRIAGTGGGFLGEAVVVVGNLLLDFPHARMTRAWRTPSPSFRRLAAAGLRRHLTTLRAELGAPPAMADLAELLREGYQEAFGRAVAVGTVTAEERGAIQAAETRLASEALGLTRPGPPSPRLKIARGVLVRELLLPGDGVSGRLTLRLRHGIIDAAVLDPPAGDGWPDRLRAAPLEQAALTARLLGVPGSPVVVDTLLALGREAAETG
jgi:lipoate-protein ligase A